MADQHKIAVLRSISTDAALGTPTRLSFNSLGKTHNLSKQELDTILTELNKERFISQYVKKGVDSFTVVLNQKGLDAVEDESFI